MIEDNNKNIIEHGSYKYLLSNENIVFYACTTCSNNDGSSILNWFCPGCKEHNEFNSHLYDGFIECYDSCWSGIKIDNITEILDKYYNDDDNELFDKAKKEQRIKYISKELFDEYEVKLNDEAKKWPFSIDDGIYKYNTFFAKKIDDDDIDDDIDNDNDNDEVVYKENNFNSNNHC